MRRRTALTLATALVLPVAVGAAPAPESATTDEDCLRTTEYAFGDGSGVRWQRPSPDVDPDATGRWHFVEEYLAKGVGLDVDASGGDVKDARTVMPPVRAHDRTRLTVLHDRVLADDDGLVVELSTDGGATWTDAANLAVAGAPTGSVVVDGSPRPAWTGARPAVHGTPEVTRTVLDLAELAGTDVLVSWRLVQAPSAPAVPEAYVSLHRVTVEDHVDLDCRDDYEARPWAACLAGRSVLGDLHRETEVAGVTRGWRPEPRTGWYFTDTFGHDAKIDHLVTPPFTAAPTTRVEIGHVWDIQQGDDIGLLQFRVDGGDWVPVPPEWVQVGGYNGTDGAGRAGWTGASTTGRESVHPASPWFMSTVVDLGALAFEHVELAVSFMAQPGVPVGWPGREWTVASVRLHEVIDTDSCASPSEVPAHEDTMTCVAPTPDAASVRGVVDDGHTVQLDVLVLLDTAPAHEVGRLRSEGRHDEAAAALAELAEEADALLDAASWSFDAVGVEVVERFDVMDVVDDEGRPVPRATSTQQLMDRARGQLGGAAPADVDAVYVLTDLDLGTVLGQAECIGGVRDAATAFAAGRLQHPGTGLFARPEPTAQTYAHELGHLLGAHHHYANCVEGVASDPVEDPRGVCTLLFNDASLGGHGFSTANAVVVRGHALAYADD